MPEDAGALLVRSGLIASEQLRIAREAQAGRGGTIGEHLVLAGFIEDPALTDFYRTRLMVPQVKPEQLANIPESLIAKIPADMATEFRCIPVAYDRDHNLTLAMADPSATHTVDEISFFTSHYVVRCVATQSQIAWCLARYYGYLTPLGERILGGVNGIPLMNRSLPLPLPAPPTSGNIPPVAVPPATAGGTADAAAAGSAAGTAAGSSAGDSGHRYRSGPASGPHQHRQPGSAAAGEAVAGEAVISGGTPVPLGSGTTPGPRASHVGMPAAASTVQPSGVAPDSQPVSPGAETSDPGAVPVVIESDRPTPPHSVSSYLPNQYSRPQRMISFLHEETAPTGPLTIANQTTPSPPELRDRAGELEVSSDHVPLEDNDSLPAVVIGPGLQPEIYNARIIEDLEDEETGKHSRAVPTETPQSPDIPAPNPASPAIAEGPGVPGDPDPCPPAGGDHAIAPVAAAPVAAAPVAAAPVAAAPVSAPDAAQQPQPQAPQPQAPQPQAPQPAATDSPQPVSAEISHALPLRPPAEGDSDPTGIVLLERPKKRRRRHRRTQLGLGISPSTLSKLTRAPENPGGSAVTPPEPAGEPHAPVPPVTDAAAVPGTTPEGTTPEGTTPEGTTLDPASETPRATPESHGVGPQGDAPGEVPSAAGPTPDTHLGDHQRGYQADGAADGAADGESRVREQQHHNPAVVRKSRITGEPLDSIHTAAQAAAEQFGRPENTRPDTDNDDNDNDDPDNNDNDNDDTGNDDTGNDDNDNDAATDAGTDGPDRFAGEAVPAVINDKRNSGKQGPENAAQDSAEITPKEPMFVRYDDDPNDREWGPPGTTIPPQFLGPVPDAGDSGPSPVPLISDHLVEESNEAGKPTTEPASSPVAVIAPLMPGASTETSTMGRITTSQTDIAAPTPLLETTTGKASGQAPADNAPQMVAEHDSSEIPIDESAPIHSDEPSGPEPLPMPPSMRTRPLTDPSFSFQNLEPTSPEILRELEDSSLRLVEILRALDQADGRNRVIDTLIDHLAESHQRVAFFVVKSGELTTWKQRIGSGPVTKRDGVKLSLNEPSTFQDIVGTRLPFRGPVTDGISRAFVEAALGYAHGEMLGLPVAVRGRVVGVLFGDTNTKHIFEQHLAVVTRAAGVALERILRAKKGS